MSDEPPDLSSEQLALLAETARVVEAGPGSGKTRALVARFVERASTSSRGVALLSFTNAAVNEGRRRCAHTPRLLHAPHFVGTIDSFLHRFIVTPAETQRLRRLPSYRRTWDELPDAYSTVRLIKGAGVPLSAFHLDPAGNVTINPEVGWQAKAYLKQIEANGRMSDLLTRATKMMNGLNHAGVYDAHTARVKALRLLSGPEGMTILNRLTLRFAEIMVDEAQDCDEAEFGILRLLRDKGTNVVVVADPDQAIYEFRGGDPGLFLAFSAEHAVEARVRLGTNYRSTKEICKAVAVLRAAGTSAIAPYKQEDCCPVFVLSGTPEEQSAKFRQLLKQEGVDVSDAMVIAHARGDAAAVTGSGPTAGTSSAAGNRLAAACAQLRSGRGDAATRLAAVKDIEDIILSLLGWPEDMRPVGREAKLAHVDRRADWLRQSAGALAAGMQGASSREEFGIRSRQIVHKVLQPLGVPMVDLSQRLTKPTEHVWEQCQVPGAGPDALLTDSIHGVKGAEALAVLVVLPSALRKTDGKDVLDNLEEGQNTEARRVLYVGASRAVSVLAFGAGANADRLARILIEGGVVIEVR